MRVTSRLVTLAVVGFFVAAGVAFAIGRATASEHVIGVAGVPRSTFRPRRRTPRSSATSSARSTCGQRRRQAVRWRQLGPRLDSVRVDATYDGDAQQRAAYLRTAASHPARARTASTSSSWRRMTLEKGTTLAGYRITGILGQGGMGVVYEATQLTLDRKAALKVLAPHLSDDLMFRERFRREGQLQAGDRPPPHRHRVRGGGQR